MQPDELDRILSEEGSVSPSPDFTAAVMSKVMREAAAPGGIGFPWQPVVFGIASAVLSIVAGISLESAAAPPASGGLPNAMTELLNSWAAHVVAGTANPAVSALMLAVVVALVPVAVYEGYQRTRD
jgi:hypothetical protein